VDHPVDLTPAPGGVMGRPVDYVRWYPPDTPYLWGQGFPTPQMMNYFSQWTKQFLPTTHFQNPPGVVTSSHMWPVGFGQSGDFQNQLNGMGTARGTVNQGTVQRLEEGHSKATGSGIIAALNGWGKS